MTDQTIANSPSLLSPAAAFSPAAAPSKPQATAPSTAVQNPGAARQRLLLEGPIISTLLRLALPNVVVAFQERRKRQRERAELYRLNDRELTDIGMTRGEIEYVVSNRSFDRKESGPPVR